MTKRSIDALRIELQELVKSVPAFAESGWSIFNLDDLKSKSNLQTLPVAGVAYDGAVPRPGNSAVAVESRSGNTGLVVLQFSVILGLEYNFSNQDDTKPQGHNLLDDLRETVSGYKGVNNRPWVWVAEKPEDDVSSDGLIFYSQSWRTDVMSVGKSNN